MATAASIQVDLIANTARYRSAMLDAGRVTNQQMAAIRKETAATAQSIRTLNTVAGGFLGFQGLKTAAVELSRVADQYSNVQAKIRLAVGENANLSASLRDVFDISQRTYSSFDSTATLVARTTRALVSNGEASDIAFQKSLSLSEAINNAFLVSGATTAEAQNAIIQLSQGLAAGALRGEEYNSVAEQGSRITQALSEHLGVTTGRLREMAKEGKLTAEVVTGALLGSFSKLQDEADKVPLTIGRAKTQLDNAFTRFIGEADQASGASRAVAGAISALASNLGPVVNALGQLAIVTAGAFSARALLAARSYAASLLEQAAAARASQAATEQKAAADAQAAQATLLKARGEQVAAEAAVAAAAVDRQRIQSVIAMAKAQEAVIRANALRATSEIEMATLSQRLTAVEQARAAATAALGDARAAEVRANAALVTSNRSLQAAMVATGAASASTTNTMTLGMRAATLAQNSLTLATRAFSGALALVGGPLGLVIIGVGLLASGFANAKAKADEAAASFRSAIEQANSFLDNQSRAAALQAGTALLAERAAVQERLNRRTEIRSTPSLYYYDEGVLRGGKGLDEQIRQDQISLDTLNKKIQHINAQIMRNRDSWNEAGAATASAADKNKEQNAALDKQLQQLTAQRLELTKGFRARLEYEAIQEQGVKTAADLDAGTRARIDALVKEHAAVQEATQGKRNAAKVDRESLAIGKQRENQYQSIIDRINQQLALDTEAKLVTDDMTAAQKLQVVITEQLKSAKNNLTEAQKEEIKTRLQALVVNGAELKAIEDRRKGAEDLLRLQNQLNESLRTQRSANEADLFGIGRGGDAVERMRRLVDIQREYQRQVESLNLQLAAAGGDKASEAARKAYLDQMDALKAYHEAALKEEESFQQTRIEMQSDWASGARKALEDYVDAAKDVASQSAEAVGSVLGGLEDAFTDLFTKGKADWESFFNDINAIIVRFVVRQQLAKLAERFFPGLGQTDQASALTGAAGALASSATPLMSAAAALSASASALAAAGAGSAVTGTSGGGSGGWTGTLFSLFSSNWGFDKGGYTGPGARLQPAGVVHKGEGVLSQDDIRSLGGVSGFHALRSALRRGYADGGLVGGSHMVRVGRSSEQSVLPGGQRSRPFQQTVNVNVSGRMDRRTPEQIARATGREAQRGLARTGR